MHTLSKVSPPVVFQGSENPCFAITIHLAEAVSLTSDPCRKHEEDRACEPGLLTRSVLPTSVRGVSSCHFASRGRRSQSHDLHRWQPRRDGTWIGSAPPVVCGHPPPGGGDGYVVRKFLAIGSPSALRPSWSGKRTRAPAWQKYEMPDRSIVRRAHAQDGDLDARRGGDMALHRA